LHQLHSGAYGSTAQHSIDAPPARLSIPQHSCIIAAPCPTTLRTPHLSPLTVCSYPFEIHDDALVLRKMLELDQQLAGVC
jgi:hypothetical protein